MNILLVDSNTPVRSEVEARLEEAGLSVLSFADARFAFLYLLSHFDEVDAVALNRDTERGFLRRLDVLGPVAGVTYSGADLEAGGEIVMALMPADHSADRAKIPAA